MHTFKFSEDSWILRYYCWAWGADEETADFCKMFWGILFGILLFPFIIAIHAVERAVSKREKEQMPFDMDSWKEEQKKKKERLKYKREHPGHMMRMLTTVAHFFSKHKKIGEWGLKGLWTLLVLWIVGYFLFMLITKTKIMLLVLAGTAVFCGLVYLISEHGGALGKPLKKIGRGFDRLVQFLYHGYRSVKTATCPKIEVVKKT